MLRRGSSRTESRVSGRRASRRTQLDGLLNEPRPGALRTISELEVERVIANTLHEKPREATHWSSRIMAKATGLS